jgi:hypothetical protein
MAQKRCCCTALNHPNHPLCYQQLLHAAYVLAGQHLLHHTCRAVPGCTLTHGVMSANDADALPVVNVELQPKADCHHLWLLLCFERCAALINAGQSRAALLLLLLLLPSSTPELAGGRR